MNPKSVIMKKTTTMDQEEAICEVCENHQFQRITYNLTSILVSFSNDHSSKLKPQPS